MEPVDKTGSCLNVCVRERERETITKVKLMNVVTAGTSYLMPFP